MKTIISRAGFTAIELAVVMGVILLMVGLTLPAISRSMRKGRLAESVNTFQSMHQQAMSAAQQYQMTWGKPGTVTLSIIGGDKLRLRISGEGYDKDSLYSLPTTVEAGNDIPPILVPPITPITTLTYLTGTGLPNNPAPRPYFFFQTTDGKDKTRIFIADSGLTKVETL